MHLELVRVRVVWAVREAPVATCRDLSVLPDEDVRWRQLPKAGESAHRVRDVLELEETVDGVEVDVPRNLGVLQNRLRLRSEPEVAASRRVEEWLLAAPVASAKEAPATHVPEGEGEHPAQAVHAVVAVVLVQMHDDLRVGVSREPMAARLQLVAQLHVVVDLSVEDDDDRAVFVGDRLIARLQIDDREPLDAKADALLYERALGVRSAMPDDVAHSRDQ